MVLIYRVRMADGAAARTDGVSIWVNEDLNEIEERCAVAHEMEHIRRGEGTCQPEYVELEVRYAVAAQLLPDLDTIPCEGDDLAEIARFWGVTRRVLMDRAVTLTREQSITAGCFSCLKCPSQRARMREVHPASRTNERHPRMVRRVAVAA